jgi:hypothetical protein
MRETPRQRIWRDRIEMLIGAATPALDLLLGAGERVSRALAPGDSDYYPIRSPSEAFELGPVQSDDPARGAAGPVD